MLLLLWRRPELLGKVISPLREANVARIYVAVDGPNEKTGVREDVEEVKLKVLALIDWNCEVRARYADRNMGCKTGVSDAIDWFFKNEEKGIIIEDDVIVDVSFIRFAHSLLNRYEHEERIGSISACSYNTQLASPEAYDFTCFVHVWGWATWRRVWELYSSDLSRIDLDSLKKGLARQNGLMGSGFKEFWMKKFYEMKNDKIDTWDYQLQLLFLERGLLSCTPKAPLSSNVGFGSKASHTKSISLDQKVHVSSLGDLSSDLPFPSIKQNTARDKATFRSNFSPSIGKKVTNKLKALLRYG